MFILNKILNNRKEKQKLHYLEEMPERSLSLGSRLPSLPLLLAFLVLVCGAVPVTAASGPTLSHLLTKPFVLGVVTDTYGSFNASLQIVASSRFEGAHHGSTLLTSASSHEDGTSVPAQVEVDLVGPFAGDARIFFGAANADDAADITFSFAFHTGEVSAAGGATSTYWEATGRYQTNRISFGTFWWRFVSDHEFTLQFVDHVFTNTTTIHGFAQPDASSSNGKPWWQNWGMVLVTLGVFLIKTWLGVINAKRSQKAEKTLLAQKRAAEQKKKN